MNKEVFFGGLGILVILIVGVFMINSTATEMSKRVDPCKELGYTFSEEAYMFNEVINKYEHQLICRIQTDFNKNTGDYNYCYMLVQENKTPEEWCQT